ncbi:hypothetical protein [Streptomyces resistomycificus]|uniref:hypothetical protein n=1 Tax=Streptomyces resistomycificus TaxID=67356 RepID=UPI000FE2176D|nr:hypothetical protein [Streptomyces resistomycificus]
MPEAARRIVAHLAEAPPDHLLTRTESDWPEAYIAVDESFVAALCPGRTPLPPLHPVTLIQSRYGGAYEPGRWLAFPSPPDDLPDGWDEEDVPCLRFWEANPRAAGGGRTPAEAYAVLLADVLHRNGGNGATAGA